MTGLDKILKAIEEEAQAKADTIVSEAKKNADEIMLAAEQEAAVKCSLIADKSAADVQAVISRAESAAALLERKMILEAKQQIISNIITKARESLNSLADPEFTEIILSMVKQFAHNRPGKILFSAADKKRLPENFHDRLNAALAGKASAALQAAEDTANIESGFRLEYGDIEENCSFDALFAAAKENLQDKVNSVLFE